MSYITDKVDDEVVRLLQSGGIGLLPSDTIYGLSCLALDETAVKRLHQLKGRPENKPFVILISDSAQLAKLRIDLSESTPVLRYWPGSLTFVCPAPKAPNWLHMGTGTLAVRQPDKPELCDLIAETGPIISTSANISGKNPASSIKGAQKYFGDKLDFYVDIGPVHGKASTIVQPKLGKLEVLRQGAVRIDEKEAV